jgi:hypothetical protein
MDTHTFVESFSRIARALLIPLALSACGATHIGEDLASDPHGWEGEGRVIRQASVPLSRELTRGFKEATRGAVYFGAIHINPETDRYFYARNWNSLAAAIDVTRAQCEDVSTRGRCILAATVVPARLRPETTSAEGFGVSTLHRYRLIYRSQHARRGQWGAFAYAALSASGIALDQPDRAAAEALAAANCEAFVKAEMARFSPSAQQVVRNKGYDRCRVVDVVGPLTPPRN